MAMMRDEVVHRRTWLTRRAVPRPPRRDEPHPRAKLDRDGDPHRLSAPSVGRPRRRRRLLHPAGHVHRRALGVGLRPLGAPRGAWLLYGVKPVILAIVPQALWSLRRPRRRAWPLPIVGAVALAASLLGANQLLILFACGVLVAVLNRAGARRVAGRVVVPLLLVAAAAAGLSAVSLPECLVLPQGRIGPVRLRVRLARVPPRQSRRAMQWLTEASSSTPWAAGQVTPGPLFTTATFIGYLLSGPDGAIVATACSSSPRSFSWRSAGR